MADRLAGWAKTRAALNDALADEGFVVMPNAATWFSCIDLPASGIAIADHAFAERAVMEARVASIPVSALCEGETMTTALRLCHCKPEPMLIEAVERLARFRDELIA